jgi:hypothetical protein
MPSGLAVLLLLLALQGLDAWLNRPLFTPITNRYKSIREHNVKKTILQVVPGAGIAVIEGFSEAFIGGTVGVMSVAFILELKKANELSTEVCPYCMGSGQLLCGICLGAGVTMVNGVETECSVCHGTGLVLCINCKGDGRATPIMLQSKGVRSPEFSSPDSVDIDSP